MALTATVRIDVDATLTNPMDLSTPSDVLDFERLLSLTNGTGANQGDMLWHDERTLTASANEDIDLAGSLTDAFGATQTFVRLHTLIVTALSANTNNVNVTRPASNGVPWLLAGGDGVAIPPGGVMLFSAGDDATDVVVTAGTGDLINIANSGGGTSVTYRIIIIGASA